MDAAKRLQLFGCILGVAALPWVSGQATADETHADQLLQAMSTYLAGLDSFSFDVDIEHEVVSPDGEKFGLRSSGEIDVHRPGNLSVRRSAGFTEVDFLFDGEILSIQDAASGLRTQMQIAGDIDTMIDTLRDDLGRPLPAADLLTGEAYGVLMEDVTEVKDLGSGVVNGVECDHLAFRNPQVDWQIWIAQGDTPHPCMLVITTSDVDQAPQYRISVRDWEGGRAEIPATLAGDGFKDVGPEEFSAGAMPFPPNFSLEDN